MIVIEPINNDYYEGFKMEGHADYAPRGQDVVCAGVSSALFTTYYALSSLFGQKIEATMESGYAHIRIHEKDSLIETLVNSFIDVVVQIQASYPDTIKIKGDKTWEEALS